MKVFISLPILPRAVDRCRERAARVKEMIERRGHQAVSPFDVPTQPGKPMRVSIGTNIEALIGCDAVLRCTGWSASRWCALESECAHIYKKKIFDHIDQLNLSTQKV